MIRRLRNTNHIIVAGGAGMQVEVIRCVIKYTTGEGARSVTGLAILCRGQVPQRRRWLAGGIGPIMAGITAYAGNGWIGMVDKSLRELRGVMTGTTILCSCQMTIRFTVADYIVMAVGA